MNGAGSMRHAAGRAGGQTVAGASRRVWHWDHALREVRVEQRINVGRLAGMGSASAHVDDRLVGDWQMNERWI